MKRFLLLLSIAVALGAALRAADRPNILFIFADDHAWQAISAYGGSLNQTPNIDRLAKEGMRFDRCLVTNSICAPSRAVVLTGKYGHLNGQINNSNFFDGAQQTFPKLLKKAGYQTAIVGKWHLGSDPTGFDYWNILPGQGAYYNPDLIDNGKQHRVEGYTTDVLTDAALDWLKKGRAPDKPFLLMYQHKAPHRNWMPSPRHLTLYKDRHFSEPPTLFDDYAGRASPAHNQKMEIARDMTLGPDLKIGPDQLAEANVQAWQNMRARMTPAQLKAWDDAYRAENMAFVKDMPKGKDLVRWKYQRYIKDYLRSIAAVDENVGRVLDYLDQSGLAKNTIVVYTSDQGFYLGEHGWFDKRWMYEESFRTPLLVRWPGVTKAGATSDAMVSNLDFAETLLDVAGVKAPADMQGRSFVPILRGQTPPDWRKTFYYHYYEETVHGVARHYGVATDRYKLIHYYQVGEWEMFDLTKDPHEMHSVYSEPAYAKEKAVLEKELARLRRELKVPEKDPEFPNKPPGSGL